MVAQKQKSGGTINMNISEEGKSLIKKFEGCKLEAYLCSANVWTCGWGATRNVKEGDSWSQSYADERFDGDIVEFEDYVNKYVEVPLNQNQFDALVAWVYNLGPNNLKESTMLKVLNEGKYELVPSEIKRWNKAGGEVLEGLERRRLAESMLFQGNGDWHTV
jgi:lysozyme